MSIRVRNLAILSVLALPCTALANAGTPLMWAGMLHLMFGNALLGIAEGLLLSLIFKAPKLKSIGLLIVANYLSAWSGGMLFAYGLSNLPDITIESLKFWFFAFLFIAFAITLLIELPFFALALKRKGEPLQAPLKPTLTIHLISYAALLAWYGLASQTSLMWKLDAVAPSELPLPENLMVYYLSPDGSEVVRAPLDGTKPERLLPVASTNESNRLFARPATGNQFDLWLRLETGTHHAPALEPIQTNFTQTTAVDPRWIEDPDTTPQSTWFNFGTVPSIAKTNAWEYRTGFWAAEGIVGDGPNGEHFRYSLETPFITWGIRNATHLEGNLLLFQLGADQICLLHPESRRIALIARGKGPLVAKPN